MLHLYDSKVHEDQCTCLFLKGQNTYHISSYFLYE